MSAQQFITIIACFFSALGTPVLAEGNLKPMSGSIPAEKPLVIGDTIPNVTVTSIKGKEISLRRLISKKPSIVIFYRGGWCPYCNTHLAKIQQIEPDLIHLGYQIIAISADRISELDKTIEKQHLKYSLYSDSTMNAAKAFGLAYTVDSITLNKMKLHGVDLEYASGQKHHMLPVPAAFVVDKKGIIKFAHSNPDIKVRIDPNDLLGKAREALEAK
jgi:peroxiredoxin